MSSCIAHYETMKGVLPKNHACYCHFCVYIVCGGQTHTLTSSLGQTLLDHIYNGLMFDMV